MTDAPRPVLLLTGDLGAGKTTLVNRLLAEAAGRRIVVIENEAGEIGIDAELLVGASAVLDLPEGCACCTVRGALTSTLEELAERTSELDVLVVELSGLADPVPIVQAFQEPLARAAFRIAALVAVVSATGPTGGGLWRRQLRFADAVVISKLEGAMPPNASTLAAVRGVAPGVVPVLAAASATLDGLLATRRGPAPPEDAGHDHGVEPRPATVALELDTAVDRRAFDVWLLEETGAAGPDLVRAKAIAAVADSELRYVVQVAHGQWSSYDDRPWLGPRRTRVVLIGHGLDAAALRAGLERCRAPEGRPALPAAAGSGSHHHLLGDRRTRT